jgi:hypothetical protein
VRGRLFGEEADAAAEAKIHEPLLA